MTPDQFEKLIVFLQRIADRQFTITSASDWPLLLAMGAVVAGLIGFMWRDLRANLKDNKSEWQQSIRDYKDENVKAHDALWSAMRDCKEDCCPMLHKNQRVEER